MSRVNIDRIRDLLNNRARGFSAQPSTEDLHALLDELEAARAVIGAARLVICDARDRGVVGASAYDVLRVYDRIRAFGKEAA